MHMIVIFPNETLVSRREEACRRLHGLLVGELSAQSVIVVEPITTEKKNHVRVLVDTSANDLTAQVLTRAADILVHMFGAQYAVTLRTFAENGPAYSYTRPTAAVR